MLATDDTEQLRLLSIFHYVVAGLIALFSLFPVIHLLFGIAIVTGQMDGPQDPPAFFGWMFILMALVFIIFGLAFAACVAFAGRFLSRRENYTYCFVIAAVICAAWPIGTALGVFTIIVLMRETVKQEFKGTGEVRPTVS